MHERPKGTRLVYISERSQAGWSDKERLAIE